MISCESLITPKKDVPESSLFPPLHVHETEFKRCQDIFIKSHWVLGSSVGKESTCNEGDLV